MRTATGIVYERPGSGYYQIGVGGSAMECCTTDQIMAGKALCPCPADVVAEGSSFWTANRKKVAFVGAGILALCLLTR